VSVSALPQTTRRLSIELGLADFQRAGQSLRAARRSRHSALDRLTPSLSQYDYLILSRLQESVSALIRRCSAPASQACALDLGASESPYRSLLEESGYTVKTLDLDKSRGADFQGTLETTGLPDDSFDLVLCTEVMEHSLNPWQGIQEIRRILKPSGLLIVSAPHVWFYHPHPTDHWRFTQEGLVHLCRMGGLQPEALFAQGGSAVALLQIVNFLAYGLLGKAGTPFYFATNLIARSLDRVVSNADFCLNFACLARK
jgi:SAM-dependent methyltransferase